MFKVGQRLVVVTVDGLPYPAIRVGDVVTALGRVGLDDLVNITLPSGQPSHGYYSWRFKALRNEIDE